MSAVERPILFSAPMVRALLAGTKTQTRRICERATDIVGDHAASVHPDGSGTGFIAWWPNPVSAEETKRLYPEDQGFKCPHGKPGDRIWVRETWRTAISLDDKSPSEVGALAIAANYRKPWAPIKYEADGATDNADVLRDFGGKWGKTRVSIHMPRWASRITLEITGVRVERLQDISRADAIAEGGPPSHPSIDRVSCDIGFATDFSRSWYAQLWESIHGEGSWALNPWVWAITFRRIGP